MQVKVSFWIKVREGDTSGDTSGTVGGWSEAALGRMTLRTENGLTETIIVETLKAFAEKCAREHPDTPEPYDPSKVMVSGTFGDYGTFYVDGTGQTKEKLK